MKKNDYQCTRCGRLFQAEEGEKEIECPACGSKDVTAQSLRPTASSCGAAGRFQ